MILYFRSFRERLTYFNGMAIPLIFPMVRLNLPNQNFVQIRRIRIGDNIYGLQFHVEVTDEMIYQWIDAYRDEVDSLKGIVDPDQIISDTKAKSEDYKAQAKQFCTNFFKLI